MQSTATILLFALAVVAVAREAKDDIDVESLESCIHQEFASDIAAAVCAKPKDQHSSVNVNANRVICTRSATCIALHHFGKEVFPACRLTNASSTAEEKQCALTICSTELGQKIYFQCTSHVELACQRVSNTLLFRNQDALMASMFNLTTFIGNLSGDVAGVKDRVVTFQAAVNVSLDAHKQQLETVRSEAARAALLHSGALASVHSEMVAQLAAADAKTERRIKEESFGLKQAFTLMCATGVAMVLVVSVVVGWCCARRNQLTTEEFDTLFSILAVNPDTQTHKTLRSGKTYSPSTGPARYVGAHP